MEKLKAVGEYDKQKGTSLVFGRKKEIPSDIPPDDLILIGDCLKKYRTRGIFVGGCPPPEPFPLWAIIDRKPYSSPDDISGFDLRTRMDEEARIFQK